jgi:hypothetical protein
MEQMFASLLAEIRISKETLDANQKEIKANQ